MLPTPQLPVEAALGGSRGASRSGASSSASHTADPTDNAASPSNLTQRIRLEDLKARTAAFLEARAAAFLNPSADPDTRVAERLAAEAPSFRAAVLCDEVSLAGSIQALAIVLGKPEVLFRRCVRAAQRLYAHTVRGGSVEDFVALTERFVALEEEVRRAS